MTNLSTCREVAPLTKDVTNAVPLEMAKVAVEVKEEDAVAKPEDGVAPEADVTNQPHTPL